MAATRDGTHETSDQRFLLVQEAAAALAVSAMTLYRMIQARQFPALRLRSRWIIPAGAVDKLTTGPRNPIGDLGSSLLDVPFAAGLLRVSAPTLYRLIHDGGFPAVWLRGRVLVPGSAIDDMASAAVSTGAAIDPKDWVRAGRNQDPNPGSMT